MICILKNRPFSGRPAKTTILLLLSVVFLFALNAGDAAAQKKFSKSYPAGKHVRLRLTNRTGKVAVEGWGRPEVSVTAYLEKPAAYIAPQEMEDGTIYINLVKDNQGRSDVGSVNFTVRVPYDASVDIETRIGNLEVSNVRGTLVSANISADGDITLTNISAMHVAAENGIGNIFFDGLIIAGGKYRFSSRRGDINLRVPMDSSFRLIATAPSTRSINLGSFSSGNMRYVGDGRRVVGQSGDGGATLTVTNLRGTIAFIRR